MYLVLQIFDVSSTKRESFEFYEKSKEKEIGSVNNTVNRTERAQKTERTRCRSRWLLLPLLPNVQKKRGGTYRSHHSPFAHISMSISLFLPSSPFSAPSVAATAAKEKGGRERKNVLLHPCVCVVSCSGEKSKRQEPTSCSAI